MLHFIDLDNVDSGFTQSSNEFTPESIMSKFESCSCHEFNGKYNWITAKSVIDNRWYSTDGNEEYPTHYYITNSKPEFIGGRMVYVNKELHKSFMRIAGFDCNNNDVDSLFPINGEIIVNDKFCYFKDNIIGSYFGFHENSSTFTLVEDTYLKKMLSVDEVISIYDEYVVIGTDNGFFITNGNKNEGYFELYKIPEDYKDAKACYDYYSFI